MQFKISMCILSLIGCMFLPTAALAEKWGDFTYEESGGSVIITGYTGSGGAVVIPDTINSMTVVTIGDNAFIRKSSITSITIPGSVTRIGNDAFAWCDGLTSLTIPGSVTSIGKCSFYTCTGLTSLTIPGSVTSIGSRALASCTGLTSIDVDISNPGYSSQDGVLYNKAGTTLLQYPAGKSGGFNIPGGVTSIETCAFYPCDGLTSLTVPGSVTSIGWWALAGCSGLTSIEVDSSNSKYSSQDGVLYNKAGTELLQYPAGKPGGWVIIPSSVTCIGPYAFKGCTGLTDVYIMDGITRIEKEAFVSCTALTGTYFFGNAPQMQEGEGVFEYCASGFTVYYLPESTGFANPWYGYPTAVFDPSDLPITTTTTTIDTATTTTTTSTANSRGTWCAALNVLGEENPDLENLRAFRDGPLAQSAVGRRLIEIYYNNGESINDALDRSPVLRAVARRFFETVAALMENKQSTRKRRYP